MSMVPSAFPRPTADAPIEIFASMEPAREVGGDLYDFFYSDDGTLCFLVGDVSGKGMPAALFMARAKSLIRFATELMRPPSGALASPSEIIARVNRELCQNNNSLMFVSLFFGMLQPKLHEFLFCNAGHNPPYRLAGKMLEAIDGAKGIVLGVSADAVYETGLLSLDPAGASSTSIQDGVTEASNEIGALFSEERLEAALRSAGAARSADVVKSVTAAVRAFVGKAEQADDVTAMADRRVEPSAL